VLASLERMVVKPVDGSGGYGLVIGTSATETQLAQVRNDIVTDPRSWIAQPIVELSTCPTLVDTGLEPRHVDLRPFAVNDGTDAFVLPGGLTRVALPKGSLVVNSSQGGGSKDTWVLDEGGRGQTEREDDVPLVTRVRRSAVARHHAPVTAEDRLRQQEGQQQQSAAPQCIPGSGEVL
jgi:uncharacterized circularly permuted ATP-grasp superfamily protein